MAEDQQPRDAGVSDVQQGFPKESVEYHQLKFSEATALSDLADEYVFYTPALIHLRLRLGGREPFHDFVEQYGKPVIPFTMTFPKPIFQGLDAAGDPFWNHALMATEKEHWDAFGRWMHSIAFLDRELGLMVKVQPTLITIADPLKLSKLAVVPTEGIPKVNVVVFALDTNKGCVYIDASGNPLLNIPRATVENNIFKDTAVFANAVLADDAEPHQRVAESEIDPSLGISPQEAWLLENYGDREPAKVAGTKQFADLPASEQQTIIELAEFYRRTHGGP